MSRPPHFHAVAAFGFRPNRVYRIYVLTESLLFAYVGPDKDVDAATIGTFLIGGLIGLMVMNAVNGPREPSEARPDRLEDLDDLTLDELRDEHKHNFEAGPDEFPVARFRPHSFWHALNYQDKAILQLRHPTRGSLRLAIPDGRDARLALRELGRVFGGDLSVEAEWSRDRGQFVRLGRGDG